MKEPEPVVIIRDLSFHYPTTLSGRRVTALRDVNLTMERGGLTLITGESGSGKSTLARCLNGLIPHATKGIMKGTVTVMGMDTRDHDVTEFARHVGMVFQDPGYQLVTGDVESEIAFGLEIQNLPERAIRDRIAGTADLLRIPHLLGRRIDSLSWGERQRVAIASVLAVRPSLLVMDEPLSGIDAPAARNLATLLLDLKARSGTTIIVFEHRTSPLLPVADRLVTMRDGGILSDMSPAPMPAPGTAPLFSRSPVRELPLQSVGGRPAPSLSFHGVHYRYPGTHTDALDGITLDFYPGELAVITGPNGSGKTTMLKHCNGLLVPDRGAVLIGSGSTADRTVAALAGWVGLLNQHADYQLFESTIRDEVAFGPRNLMMEEDAIRTAIQKVLRQCSLDRIDPSTPPLSLSGGEKQRVAIAGILAMDTPCVVLDEPTFGLDPGVKDAFSRVLREITSSGKTVIVATHDTEFGKSCGDRFIGISKGRIESDSGNHGLPENSGVHRAIARGQGECNDS